LEFLTEASTILPSTTTATATEACANSTTTTIPSIPKKMNAKEWFEFSKEIYNNKTRDGYYG